jgi:hypothetical protein
MRYIKQCCELPHFSIWYATGIWPDIQQVKSGNRPETPGM